MKEIIQQSKVIVFDMDGTLYEGTSHFDYYAKQIENILPENIRPLFRQDYEKMIEGEHPLKVGTVYDAELDYILTISPITLEVSVAHDWEGKQISAQTVEELYPNKIEVDNTKRMLGIGDGWFLPVATAVHYGARNFYHCYDKTKEFMVSDQFHLEKTVGLKEALERLKETKKLVLMTNSDADDAERLLEELELTNLFDFEITSANKPIKTEQHLKKIQILYDANPEEIVSVGDNMMNDIAPALRLGMYGVYITPQASEYNDENMIAVTTLAGLF